MALIEVFFGAAWALFQPAYIGLIPQTVPEGEIQAAQALTGFSTNLATVLGPVIATALVLTVGAGRCSCLTPPPSSSGRCCCCRCGHVNALGRAAGSRRAAAGRDATAGELRA